jgi:penicillin-binding protein 1A
MAEKDSANAGARKGSGRLFRWVVRTFIVLFVLGGIAMTAIALAVRHYEKGLPTTTELSRYSPPQVTRILAKDGTLLGEHFVERRTVVKLDDVPAHVKLAFLAAEDASFYEHEGLDYPGMLRAIYVNLRSQSSRQGASTITQQVVKNVLLTQERTYERKIKEVILSRRIEQELSKDAILELYLNHIYFGHGRYGVEEASRYYFGKGVGDLTLGEATILAGVPKGPSLYSPRDHLDRSLKRREFILAQMIDKGFAKPEIAEEARGEAVVLRDFGHDAQELAPEAVAEVLAILKEKVGDDAARGGYVVETTIDPKLQAEARKALRDGLDAFDKRQKNVAPLKKPKKAPAFYEGDPTSEKNKIFVGEVTGADDTKNELFVRVGKRRGRVSLSSAERYNRDKLPASSFAEIGAPVRVSLVGEAPASPEALLALRLELGPQAALVAIDVATRDVLAIAGSYEGARATLDRTSQAKRQPGSAFKPFVYAAAIKGRKFTAASLLPTDPRALQGYSPKNHDPTAAGAPMRARDALAKSVNTSAAWLLGQVGAEDVARLATDLGVESPLGATPSLALGAYEVTPRELASAYASLAAAGEFEEPRLITRIVAPNGQEIPLGERSKRRVLEPAEAYVVTSLLESVVNDGTGRAAKVLKRPIAGKTGTSNEARDAWFAGYSTDVACAVWTGFDDHVPLGAGESGGASALPIFVSFMRAAHQGRPATSFPSPRGVSRTRIDKASGLLPLSDQDETLEEVFLSGTEPTESAKPKDEEGGGKVEGTPVAPGPSASQPDPSPPG